ncbi:MAG: class I SAM-dependent methyltransferase [Nitrospiraceae bacterium]
MDDLVHPAIETYCADHSMAESAACRALREETQRTMDDARMLTGPYEAAFLKQMVRLTRARRVLEIGMFTGYSALSMAEMVPRDGEVITCELDDEPIALARRAFAQSPHGRKIRVLHGPALETLREVAGPFDVIFIDADKQNYPNYYRRALELLAPTGVILVDNVLWSGDVLQDPAPDDRTRAIQTMNRLVADDPRVQAVLVPIRDGLSVITWRAGEEVGV